MSLRGRVTNLERGHPARPPMVIFYVVGGQPPLSDEDMGRLKLDAMKRDPGRLTYVMTVPPQERGQDDPHR